MRGNKAGALGVVGAAGIGGWRPPVRPYVFVRPPTRSFSAREEIIAIFPSLELGEHVAISGESARTSTRKIVYSVDVYYCGDHGEEFTRLSSLSWPTEVEDWAAVERVEVLLENGGQVDFHLKDGVVIG